MNAQDRQFHDRGYGQMSTTALLLFGYAPSRFKTDWREIQKYEDEVIAWWLAQQNEGTATKRGYRFFRYFIAWQKDELARARREGRL